MKKLMKKLLENNLSLKIASVLIAVFLWFWVTNLEDPVKTQNFSDIPITITNGSYLESMGLTCILSETDKVKVSIEGNRSVVDKISSSDIVVTADLTQIVSLDSDPVMVPITATCTKYPNMSADSINTYPSSISLDLETLTSESFVVMPSTDGTKPSKEYEVGKMEASVDQITITGPESLINKIDKVVAKVNVTNMSESKTLDGTIVVIDKNQEALKENQLSYLKMKDIQDNSTVQVKVDLWRLVTGIRIKASASGTPKPGYQVGEVTAVPAEISVIGSDEALALLAFQNNTITIPETEIDASGKSEDFVTKIDISQFLPANIRLATDVSENVLINTKILPDGSKAFNIPISNISQVNLGTNLIVSYVMDSIEVRIKGKESLLNGLKGEEIKGTIDLSGLTPGQYTVPVTLELASGLHLVSEATVDITIAETEVTNGQEISNQSKSARLLQ